MINRLEALFSVLLQAYNTEVVGSILARFLCSFAVKILYCNNFPFLLIVLCVEVYNAGNSKSDLILVLDDIIQRFSIFFSTTQSCLNRQIGCDP